LKGETGGITGVKLASDRKAATNSAQIHLRFIGGFGARVNGKVIEIRKRKARAVLGALALQPGHSCTREFLRGLLWTDSSETDAQNSLRNAIWTLNTALQPSGEDLLNADRLAVWVAPDQLHTDIDDLLLAVESGDPPTQLLDDPHLFDRILPDLFGLTDLFDAQLHAFIDRTRSRFLDAVQNLADATIDDDARIRLLQLLRAVDPLNESFCRQLILAFAAAGRVSDALGTYQLLWNSLDEMFGEEPSAETQEIIVRLKMRAQSGPGPGTAYGIRGDAARPRIIVASTSRAADLALGAIRESCIASLARFREWRIIDADHLNDPTPGGRTDDYLLRLSRPELGPELGADGSRFLALLSNQSTGEVLWSESFDGLLDESSDGQVDAIRRLAMALNIHLTASGLAHRPEMDRTDREATYGRWVRAQNLVTRFTPHSWAQAEIDLDALIAEFPQFGRAYSSRAGIENMRPVSFPGVISKPEQHLRGLTLSAQALALDPMDSRAQLAMGWSCAMAGQFERAELAFDLAYSYNENDPWTIASSAVGLAFCDHFPAARERARLLTALGFRLQPAHWSYIAATRFMALDFRGAVDASERSEEITPDVSAWHAAALHQLGQRDRSRERARRFFDGARARWVGHDPPTRQNMTAWLLSALPIRNPAHRQTLEQALLQDGAG
jgi:DNA-binding SARP family transcriptional activator